MDKQTTKGRLIQAATDLFSRKWYSDVSVADICRTAHLSNGVFYRYFKNKEAIFKLLVEEFLLLIEKKLRAISGETLEERLEQLIEIFLRLTPDECKQVSIFREGQYRFFEYEKRLQEIYHDALNRVYDRPLTEAEAFYILSGLRFAAYRTQFNRIPIDAATIKHIILQGIFTDTIKDETRIFNKGEVTLLNVSIEENTRERLLKSGRTLFGSKDYYHVNIYEITSQAGLATGTFYKHFDSKLLFFCEIIEQISHDMRGFIHKNLDSSLNRLEQEIQGAFLFWLFLTIDRSCYNIVREAEFVVKEKVKEYYDDFEHGYLNNLRDLKHTDTRTVANFLIGISHYFGIEMLFNTSARNAKESLMRLTQYLMNGISS